MEKITNYLQHVHNSYPVLEVKDSKLYSSGGQFNDVVFINSELIFRFPRSEQAVETLALEISVLRKIKSYLTLPLPDPIYVSGNLQAVGCSFMGYRMIPGEPFYSSTMHAIEDEIVLERLAVQIATFLQELHAIPADELDVSLPVFDTYDYWQDMYQRFRRQLFPYMRSEACELVMASFETFLKEPLHFTYEPVIRHGDFGGSNILYNPRTQNISGVIDFGSVGLGDPATDIASLSTVGETFLTRICNVYPQSEMVLERARFYKSTFALQQALYALQDGDQEAFEDGISSYR